MSRLLAKNEHLVDRALRVLLGLGLLSLMFVGPHTALGYIGLVPLATGLLGSCRCTRFSVSRPAACRPTRRLIGSAADEGLGHLHGDDFTSCGSHPGGIHGRFDDDLATLDLLHTPAQLQFAIDRRGLEVVHV